MPRLFVSIGLPKAVYDEIGRVQQEIKNYNMVNGSFIQPSDGHITVCFIGEVAVEQVEDIKKILQTISYAETSAQLTELAWFQKNGLPSILYLGVECPGLASLADDVKNALMPWITDEQRPFIAHITIMRVRTIVESEKAMAQLRAITVEPLTFDVQSFELVESEETEEGTRYKVIDRFNAQ